MDIKDIQKKYWLNTVFFIVLNAIIGGAFVLLLNLLELFEWQEAFIVAGVFTGVLLVTSIFSLLPIGSRIIEIRTNFHDLEDFIDDDHPFWAHVDYIKELGIRFKLVDDETIKVFSLSRHLIVISKGAFNLELAKLHCLVDREAFRCLSGKSNFVVINEVGNLIFRGIVIGLAAIVAVFLNDGDDDYTWITIILNIVLFGWISYALQWLNFVIIYGLNKMGNGFIYTILENRYNKETVEQALQKERNSKKPTHKFLKFRKLELFMKR